MSAIIWTPELEGIFASIWAPGGPISPITPTEGDVLVLSLVATNQAVGFDFNNVIDDWTVTALTESDYASWNGSAVSVIETGVYEITTVTYLNSTNNHFQNYATKVVTQVAAGTGTPGIYPYGGVIEHGTAAMSFPTFHSPQTFSAPSFTDQLIVTVATAPITIIPSIFADSYGGSGDTFGSRMTIVVRRSGDLLP